MNTSRYSIKLLPGILLTWIGLMLTGCESEYQRGRAEGYKTGKKDGYITGKTDGYKTGKEDGYITGKADGYDEGYRAAYLDKTGDYVTEKGIPVLGIAIAVVVFSFATFFIHRYTHAPIRQAINNIMAKVDARRQEKQLEQDLVQKIHTAEEIARINSRYLSNEVFEQAKHTLTAVEIQVELNKLRLKLEKHLFKVKLDEIEQIAAEYRQTLKDLTASKKIPASEKVDFYLQMKTILNKTPEPKPGDYYGPQQETYTG